MELQEGDGLMAGSRRHSNLAHCTFCGTLGNAQTETIRACAEANFRRRVTSRRLTQIQ
jgi:hypothetical protein